MTANQPSPLKLPFLDQAEVNNLVEECTQFQVTKRSVKKTRVSSLDNDSILLVPLWSKGKLPDPRTFQGVASERSKKRKQSGASVIKINLNQLEQDFAIPKFDVDNKVRQLFIEEEENNLA